MEVLDDVLGHGGKRKLLECKIRRGFFYSKNTTSSDKVVFGTLKVRSGRKMLFNAL